MRWLWLLGSLEIQVSFAELVSFIGFFCKRDLCFREPNKRNHLISRYLAQLGYGLLHKSGSRKFGSRKFGSLEDTSSIPGNAFPCSASSLIHTGAHVPGTCDDVREPEWKFWTVTWFCPDGARPWCYTLYWDTWLSQVPWEFECYMQRHTGYINSLENHWTQKISFKIS